MVLEIRFIKAYTYIIRDSSRSAEYLLKIQPRTKKNGWHFGLSMRIVIYTDKWIQSRGRENIFKSEKSFKHFRVCACNFKLLAFVYSAVEFLNQSTSVVEIQNEKGVLDSSDCFF